MLFDLTKQNVLIVDDTETNIDILVDALDGLYEISVAIDGESALETVEEEKPDLILLDIMMPGMDGYEVCQKLKESAETKDIPVIFLTAAANIESKNRGFELGAVDYITKPFEVSEVKARVSTHLTLKIARESLERQNEILEEKVRERTKEIARTQEVTIQSLTSLAETRDNETGGHIRRTKNYVKILAGELINHPKFRDQVDNNSVEMMWKSAPLHDIGKVGIRDHILLKPGKLDEAEFDEMKKHTILGMIALENAEKDLGSNSFLRFAKEIAYTHQEKWDGSGYPKGLRGEQIPLSGRIMAIADVYDALISARVYKPPFTHTKAVSIIVEGKGKHFDADLVEIFQGISEGFREIALKYADSNDQRKALEQ